jgi:hypothetical protein
LASLNLPALNIGSLALPGTFSRKQMAETEDVDTSGGGSEKAYIQQSLARNLAELRAKTRWAKEDHDIAVTEYRRQLPITLADIRDEAAARGSYESKGRIEGEGEATTQTNLAISELDRDYSRSQQEAAFQEREMRAQALEALRGASGGSGGGSSGGGGFLEDRSLSKTDLGQALKKGLISPEQYQSELQGMGYSPEDAGLLAGINTGGSDVVGALGITDTRSFFKSGDIPYADYVANLRAKGKSDAQIANYTRQDLGLGTEKISSGRAARMTESRRRAIRANKYGDPDNPFRYGTQLQFAANLRASNPNMSASEWAAWNRAWLRRKNFSDEDARKWMKTNSQHLSVVYNDAFKRNKGKAKAPSKATTKPKTKPTSKPAFKNPRNEKAYLAYRSRMKKKGRKPVGPKTWYQRTHKKK